MQQYDIERLTDRDAEWRRSLREAIPAAQRTAIPRASMPELPADWRVRSSEEVNCGLSEQQARLEATRCLDCPDPNV